MEADSALTEARSTCDGLNRLIQKISQAAVDTDSSYEMHALIASANTCAINLATQLTILESRASNDPKVLPIKRQDDSDHGQSDEKISVAK